MQIRNFVLSAIVLVITVPNLDCGGFASSPSATTQSKPVPATSSASDTTSNPILSDFELGLVRIVDLDATGRGGFSNVNVGTDPLAAGRVETEFETGLNVVKARAIGALPFATYNVLFCSFAGGLGNCMPLGSVVTDADGSASSELRFPQSGTFAGVFLLKRDSNQFQFVAGFGVTASSGTQPTQQSQPSVEDNPFGADLQRAADVTGGLGDGFTLGSDPLAAGRIEMEPPEAQPTQPGEAAENENPRPGEVKVSLQGAISNAAYQLEFCRFAAGPRGCFVIGPVATDDQGDASAELVFPQQGMFSGVFIVTRSLTRQDTIEFVTGFRVP